MGRKISVCPSGHWNVDRTWWHSGRPTPHSCVSCSPWGPAQLATFLILIPASEGASSLSFHPSLACIRIGDNTTDIFVSTYNVLDLMLTVFNVHLFQGPSPAVAWMRPWQTIFPSLKGGNCERNLGKLWRLEAEVKFECFHCQFFFHLLLLLLLLVFLLLLLVSQPPCLWWHNASGRLTRPSAWKTYSNIFCYVLFSAWGKKSACIVLFPLRQMK